VPPQHSYDPSILERYATRLERRARGVVRGVTLLGALLGGAAGSVPLTPLGHVWPVPHVFGFAALAAGAAVGALVGFAGARRRAGLLRLQAQSTLCQLHTQRTTLALWLLLKDRGLDEPAAEPAPEPVLVAEPQPEPEPEPELTLAPAPAPEPAPLPLVALAAVPSPNREPVPAFDLTPVPLAPPLTVVPLPVQPPLAPVAMPTAPPTTPAAQLLAPPLSPPLPLD
jgi:hypothetical protein